MTRFINRITIFTVITTCTITFNSIVSRFSKHIRKYTYPIKNVWEVQCFFKLTRWNREIFRDYQKKFSLAYSLIYTFLDYITLKHLLLHNFHLVSCNCCYCSLSFYLIIKYFTNYFEKCVIILFKI